MRTEAKTMRKLTLLLVAMALAVLLAALPAQAATTFTVNSINDASDADTTDGVCATAAGQCTLRAAIEQANALAGDDVIEFAPSLSGTIVLGGHNSLSISSNLKINGPGSSVLSVSADDPAIPQDYKRVFSIGKGATAAINGLTITGGFWSDNGGGILNQGTLTVSDSTITNNSARYGGGIYNVFGTLRVQRSTISGNSSHSGSGGGIFSYTQSVLNEEPHNQSEVWQLAAKWDAIDGDTLTTKTIVTNSTISANNAFSSNFGGGGVYNQQGLTRIEHSTITNNNSGTGSGVSSRANFRTRTDVFSSIISGNANTDADYKQDLASGDMYSLNSFKSLGYNLVGDGNSTGNFYKSGDRTGVADPGLEALSLNGGSTKTHALKATSPALNQGPPNSEYAQTDQREVKRPQEGTCDIGSFERDTLPPRRPSFTSPADGSLQSGSFTISGFAEEGAMVELFEIDSQVAGQRYSKGRATANSSGAWNIRLTGVTDGRHSYAAKATDAAGNTSVESSELSVKVDATALAPVITSPAEGSHNPDSFSVSGTAEPLSVVELFEGTTSKGRATAGTYGRWTIALSGVTEGSHSYTAKATDQVGNTSALSSTRTVIVDTTKPQVTSVDPAENATAVVPDANIYVTFSEEMNASTINTTTFQLYKEGSTTAIAATVSYDPIAKKATLNPDAYLEVGVTYKTLVTTGAKDLAGNALDQDPTLTGNQNKVWYFKVVFDPTDQ